MYTYAQYDQNADLDTLVRNAGLNWNVEQMPVYAHGPDGTYEADGFLATVRSDTKRTLGIGSNRRKEVQPRELVNWFDGYVKHDSRFRIDQLGKFDGGRVIWGTARLHDEMVVAGSRHIARLLMSTAYDGTMSTVNRATMVNIICRNTLQAAVSDKEQSVIKTRHTTKFDPERVGRELSKILQGFAAYKAMGDAMALKHLDNDKIVNLFRAMLDINPDENSKDLSTRKLNQFDNMSRCYEQTCRETDKNTAWAALNAVTRYVDHSRSTRGGDGNADEARFASAQFGSGAAMKQKAVLYLDELCDGELLRAVSRKTADENDVSAILKQSFRPSIAN